MSESMNIYQRINAVRKKVDYVQKNKQVSAGAGGSYKAVTHDEVTGIVRQHLVECGIVCVPTLISSQVVAPPPGKDGEPSKMIRYEATYEFRFVNIDDPKDEIVLKIEAHAMDNQDKAPGKAISYAKKYAVLKLFEIETGEDDESRHTEKGEFPLEDHLANLEAAATIQDLEAAYLIAKKAAMEWPDAPAFKIINRKTAELKEKLGAKK